MKYAFAPLVSDPDCYPMKFLCQFPFSLKSTVHQVLCVSHECCGNGKKGMNLTLSSIMGAKYDKLTDQCASQSTVS